MMKALRAQWMKVIFTGNYEGMMNILEGMSDMEASDYVYCCLMDDFVNNANEQRVNEFFDEMPPSWRTELEVLWLKAVQGAASNQERERDEGLI